MNASGLQAAAGAPTELQLGSVAAWQENTNSHFLQLDCRADDPAHFRATALVARFGDSLAAELSVPATRVIRRRVAAEHCDARYFKLFWQLQGHSRVAQGGRTGHLQPGQWSVYDTTREYQIESSERARFMVLLLPQTACPGWAPAVHALAGRALDGRGAPRIVMSALAGMLRDDARLPEDEQRTLQASVTALVECAIDTHARAHTVPADTEGGARLQRIERWILEHLAEPGLTPERVAEAFGMSRRSLYNLFLGSQRTPRAFIQDARLARAQQLMVQDAGRELALGVIAQRSGFADPAHFSRAFHARFGMAPSAWRERGARG
ncbi:MAG: helix-turn-helix domain-containing protein [Rhodocyclaceae bacterium]|nr:helix-turn-helix domain-containing protein [Rhodocyclaceae bacterium]